MRQKWIKLEDMTEAQARELFRVSADFVRRYEIEIGQMLPSLKDTIDEGLDISTYDRLRRILFYIAERTKKADKRVWTCLFALKRICGANIDLGGELRARSDIRSQKNRETINRIRNRHKTAPKNS